MANKVGGSKPHCLKCWDVCGDPLGNPMNLSCFFGNKRMTCIITKQQIFHQHREFCHVTILFWHGPCKAFSIESNMFPRRNFSGFFGRQKHVNNIFYKFLNISPNKGELSNHHISRISSNFLKKCLVNFGRLPETMILKKNNSGKFLLVPNVSPVRQAWYPGLAAMEWSGKWTP